MRLALLVTAVVAVVVTWPLALDPLGSLAGHPGNDVWNHVWGYWWVADELAHGRVPLRTDLQHFPMSSRLFFIDTFGALISLPLQWIGGAPLAMNAVVEAERRLGNTVKDVSAQKCGWDITAVTPQNLTRHIEVKGRHIDADTVIVTANEVLEALNQGEKFILAIVRIDGDRVDGPHYIRKPFEKELEGSVVSVNHSIKNLLKRAKAPELA